MYDISTYLPYWDFKTTSGLQSSGTVFDVVGANPRRPLLYISVPDGIQLWIDYQPQPTIGGTPWGILGPGYIRFAWFSDGPLSTFRWFGIISSGGGPAPIAWWEGFWHPPADLVG